MSKKHKNRHQFSTGNPTASMSIMNEHAAEYNIIKWDLIKVLVINVIFLVAVLSLYYTNLQQHYLENWFSKILHF